MVFFGGGGDFVCLVGWLGGFLFVFAFYFNAHAFFRFVNICIGCVLMHMFFFFLFFFLLLLLFLGGRGGRRGLDL